MPGRMRSARLSRLTKLGYGAAGLGDSALYGVFVSFYLYFLTDVALLAPAVAGGLIAIGTLWDAVTDPIVGDVSDHWRSRFGRRRPFMLAVAVPLGVSSCLVFSDPGFEGGSAVAYHLAMLLLYFSAYTLFYVPWTALGAQVAIDYDERSSLMSYKMGWAALGAMFGAVPLLLVETFGRALGSEKLGWSAMAATIGGIATLSILLSWRATRGFDTALPSGAGRRERTRYLREVPAIFRDNAAFRWVVLLFSTGVMAEALSAAFLVYFGQYYMGLSGRDIAVVLLIATGSGFLWLPAVNLTAQAIGKRRAYAFFLSLWVLGYLLTFATVTPGRFALLCALRAVSAGGWAAMWALGWAMIADVTDVDERNTGRRREGLYYGIVQLIQKASAGAVALTSGGILAAIGYVPDASQSQAALLGIRLTYCVGVALLLVVSIAAALRYPLTRERHVALLQEIERRRRGRRP